MARGPAETVVGPARAHRDGPARLAVYDDRTGRPVDLDWRATDAEVVARLGESRPRSRGRPRLGVVSREVSLLPRHWSWLRTQRGGASAALRRLVDAARTAQGDSAEARAVVDAAHRFLWDAAGDQPGFEGVTRALYAGDFDEVEAGVSGWPEGIRGQLARFLARARG